MPDHTRFEKQLRERQAYLEKALRRFEHTLEQPASKDDEERATEREGDEVLETLGASGLAELKAIRAALGRIGEGSYGECVNCGNPIPPKRLEIIPHAARCAKCA